MSPSHTTRLQATGTSRSRARSVGRLYTTAASASVAPLASSASLQVCAR